MLKFLYRKYKKLKDDENGSDVVSFVILIPLFFLVFALMISFSQIIYAGSVALNAANAGCRMAIVQTSKSQADTAAKSAVSSYVNSSGMGVSLSGCDIRSNGSWSRGNMCYCDVTVTVRTPVPMRSRYGNIGSSYVIKKTCPMMIERR